MGSEPVDSTRGPGRPPKRPEAVSTRELILASADKLFASKGYESTSIINIAAAAGIKQSSVYYYFDNKEAILNATALINRESLSYARRIADAGGDVVGQVYEILYYDTLHLCNSPMDFNEVERLSEANADEFSNFWGEYAELFSILADLVRAGQAEGTFRECEVSLAVSAMLSVNEGMQKRFRTQAAHASGGESPFRIPTASAEDYARTSAYVSLRSLLVDVDLLSPWEAGDLDSA